MNFADRDGVIWMDGELVPWREAKVHVLTHTLHYGMGVFEGVRAYKTDAGTAIFRLKEHTDRLFRSAHILGMHQISTGTQHMRSSSDPEGGYFAVPPAHAKAYPELLRAAGYFTTNELKHDYQFSGEFGSAPFSISGSPGTGRT